MIGSARAIVPKGRRRTLVLPLLLTLGLLLSVAPAPPAAAAPTTFVVNTTVDRSGACETLPGDCSLREAINAANSNPGTDTIAFLIPGAGVKTIRPASQLPALRDPVIIDGYTQPLAQRNTADAGTNATLVIELDGSVAGPAAGLIVESGAVTIRGLVINRFGGGGIFATGNDRVNVFGNFIGTNAAGTVAAPNGLAGILVNRTSPNASDVNVGGGSTQEETLENRNLISGNISGVRALTGPVDIFGNLIGTDRTGEGPLGNTALGIGVDRVDYRIESNTIAFNVTGISVGLPESRGEISGNAIFANSGLGIDLGDDGPTPNDPADVDAGANDLQNFPVLTSATVPAKKKGKKGKPPAKTTITGTLNSRPGQDYRIDLFANLAPQDAEGQSFLGETEVTTDASGVARFTLNVPQRLTGQAITATATHLIDNGPSVTSEFSDPVKVKQQKKKGKGKGKKGKGRG
jgi:CSLREA domain-containing protein